MVLRFTVSTPWPRMSTPHIDFFNASHTEFEVLRFTMSTPRPRMPTPNIDFQRVSHGICGFAFRLLPKTMSAPWPRMSTPNIDFSTRLTRNLWFCVSPCPPHDRACPSHTLTFSTRPTRNSLFCVSLCPPHDRACPPQTLTFVQRVSHGIRGFAGFRLYVLLAFVYALCWFTFTSFAGLGFRV